MSDQASLFVLETEGTSGEMRPYLASRRTLENYRPAHRSQLCWFSSWVTKLLRWLIHGSNPDDAAGDLGDEEGLQ